MKFKITITKEVIDKSLMCGVQSGDVTSNCAFAVAYNQIVPFVQVSHLGALFYKSSGYDSLIASCYGSVEQEDFVTVFDSMYRYPQERYSLVGQTFDVEIPDEVIEYWYGDASKAAQKIIDNPIMQVVC